MADYRRVLSDFAAVGEGLLFQSIAAPSVLSPLGILSPRTFMYTLQSLRLHSPCLSKLNPHLTLDASDRSQLTEEVAQAKISRRPLSLG